MDNIYKKNKRMFKVGINKDIEINDIGSLKLNDNDLITLVSSDGMKHEVCKKNFGYYLTQSFNNRFIKNGYKVALIKNEKNLFFIMLVETNKVNLFNEYLEKEKNSLVCWLPSDKMILPNNNEL